MSRIDIANLTDADGDLDPTQVRSCIAQLREQARDDHKSFASSERPSLEYARDGVGRAVGLYVLLRTGGRSYRFSPEEFEELEGAMNEWLELYATSHGINLESDASIRTAAELLLETDDIVAVANQLTGVDG